MLALVAGADSNLTAVLLDISTTRTLLPYHCDGNMGDAVSLSALEGVNIIVMRLSRELC